MEAINAQIRIEFSERLKGELERLGLPASSPTKLARVFNQRFPVHAVTQQTVRKWLLAEAFPAQAKLLALAQWFDVSAQWLRFGTGNRKEIVLGGTQPAANLLFLDAEHLPLLPLIERLTRLPSRDLRLIEGIVDLMLAEDR